MCVQSACKDEVYFKYSDLITSSLQITNRNVLGSSDEQTEELDVYHLLDSNRMFGFVNKIKHL